MADPLNSSIPSSSLNPLPYVGFAASASIRAASRVVNVVGGAVAGAGGAIAGAVGLRGRVANPPPEVQEGQSPSGVLPTPDFEENMYDVPPEEVVQAEMKAAREKEGAGEASRRAKQQSPVFQSSDSSDSSGSDLSPKHQADEGEKKIHEEFLPRPSTPRPAQSRHEIEFEKTPLSSRADAAEVGVIVRAESPPLLQPAPAQSRAVQVEMPTEPTTEPLKEPKRYTWVNLLAAISGIAALIFGIMSQSLLFGVAGAALLAYGAIYKHSSGRSQGKEVLNS